MKKLNYSVSETVSMVMGSAIPGSGDDPFTVNECEKTVVSAYRKG